MQVRSSEYLETMGEKYKNTIRNASNYIRVITDLGNYDTAGLATYYNTADTLTRPQVRPPSPPNIAAQTETRDSITTRRQPTLPTTTISPIPTVVAGVDNTDTDEARRNDSAGGGDIEKYAQDNLNLNCGRPKGLRLLFRKKFSVRDILSWSKDPIPQPMLVVVDGEKLLKREACNLFRLVQVYMGDRKTNVGMTLDSVAMDIVNTAFSKPPLRDELYVQICRQTTENPRKESLRRGWELMAVCLAFVPPSATFEPYLEGYMNRHRDPNFQFPEVAKWPIHVQVSHYATVACRRLQRIGAHGKRQPRKATLEDIDQARVCSIIIPIASLRCKLNCSTELEKSNKIVLTNVDPSCDIQFFRS